MLAAGEDSFSFSGDVVVGYGFSVFVDDKPLFVRLKRIGAFCRPIFCTIYVPSSSINEYRKWIKKYEADMDTKIKSSN